MHSISNTKSAADRQEHLINLYKSAFPAVAKYVSRLGGSFDEAKDVFQDALVIYYEKAVLKSSPLYNDTGYLVGIAKNLWLRHYTRSTRNLSLTVIEVAFNESEEPRENHRLMRFLSTAGQRCMDLLKRFYYDELPLHEIAEEFGYSSVRSATVQKYRCLEKVRETIKNKSLVYDDFLE